MQDPKDRFWELETTMRRQLHDLRNSGGKINSRFGGL